MGSTSSVWNIISWVFGALVFTIGVMNMVLVHPVPGIIYFLLSFIYFPPAYSLLTERFDFSIAAIVRIIMGIVIVWFTLGVSDLGDMIDKM